MLFFPYFFHRRCPSWGIAFLVSTPGRRRWYATITSSGTASSPSAASPSAAAAASLEIKIRQVMSSRFKREVQVPFLVILDVVVSKGQVLYTTVDTKYTTRPCISLGTKLFWTVVGVACFTSAAMENLC